MKKSDEEERRAEPKGCALTESRRGDIPWWKTAGRRQMLNHLGAYPRIFLGVVGSCVASIYFGVSQAFTAALPNLGGGVGRPSRRHRIDLFKKQADTYFRVKEGRMSVCAEWRHCRKKSGTAGILPVSLKFETDSMRVIESSSEDGLFLFSAADGSEGQRNRRRILRRTTSKGREKPRRINHKLKKQQIVERKYRNADT